MEAVELPPVGMSWARAGLPALGPPPIKKGRSRQELMAREAAFQRRRGAAPPARGRRQALDPLAESRRRPDAQERPPAMGLDGFERPEETDAPTEPQRLAALPALPALAGAQRSTKRRRAAKLRRPLPAASPPPRGTLRASESAFDLARGALPAVDPLDAPRAARKPVTDMDDPRIEAALRRLEGDGPRPDAEERPPAMGLDGFEPPEAQRLRFSEADTAFRRPDAEERPPAMGLDGFEPPRPDAEERPPAMGLDGFEPPADDDAPSTAAPPESPRRPEHAVHADHVEGGRVLVHHDAGETYGGDDSDDDYAEDDFDDVFDAEDIAADEAAADEPTAEPAEPATQEKPAADIWTAEPEVPGYADGAADEARAFLEQARARRGVRDVFRDEEPKKDEAEARAAEAGKLRDAVAQLGDSESAPSTAAAVEGIDDDAAFTQHIADEANASEDENPAWDSSDYSSGDFDYPVDPSTAGNSPARQRLRSGPGLGDGDVASPPARNDDDDWFAAEEPPPKKAPKEVAGYLSKFDADFERAMAKHRRHL